eukprot:1143628-Pelagomonas_calceolata.AAC.9
MGSILCTFCPVTGGLTCKSKQSASKKESDPQLLLECATQVQDEAYPAQMEQILMESCRPRDLTIRKSTLSSLVSTGVPQYWCATVSSALPTENTLVTFSPYILPKYLYLN